MTISTRLPTIFGLDVASLLTGPFIGGEWHVGAEGEPIDVIDPSMGQVILAVADATVEDAMAAVNAAKPAAEVWAATPPRRRSDILLRCSELMIERKDMLAGLISLENGKTIADAQGEVVYAAEFLRWFLEEAVRLNGGISTALGGANKIIVQHQPIGIAVDVPP